MYDKQFIFEHCGFAWIPDYIDRDLLYNVSYDVRTYEIKLYFLDKSRRFLYKVSQNGISIQHNAQAVQEDPARLWQRLGMALDPFQIQLDTVESDHCYVLIEHSSPTQYVSFLDLFCRCIDLEAARFVELVNRICEPRVSNIFECMQRRAVSMVRIPWSGKNVKLYARPFRTNNDWSLQPDQIDFLTRLHGGDSRAMESCLNSLWVSADLMSDRVLITTQRDELLEQPPGTILKDSPLENFSTPTGRLRITLRPSS